MNTFTLDTSELTSKVENLKDAKSIIDLFEYIGYKEYLRDESYVRNINDFSFNKETLAGIENIYPFLNIEKHLYGFLIESNNISKSFLRNVSDKLLHAFTKVLIIITHDWENYYFTLPTLEKSEKGNKVKLSTLPLNIKQIYHTDLEIICDLNISPELNYRDIWRNWQNAFSKERVNEEFFKEFQSIFFNLRDYVFKQCKNIKISHEFTQQTLNRIMFLYFIAKKGWLNSDPRFITNFYQTYKKDRNLKNSPPDTFYENWLSILFFEVFNNSYPNLGIAKYLPDDLKNKLVSFPYLNGGLFKKEDFDSHNITISDAKFEDIFTFLNKYNFTIKEDLPLEVDVAVDPQMLGNLYESFANVAAEIYERNDLGIFYTSTVEVDFMVKRSLTEYLLNHLSNNKVPVDVVYCLVFDDDKKKAIEYFDNHHLWDEISFLLSDIRIVDPACGSGAFLLGYLKVLVELTRITDESLNYTRSDFDLKKEIIGNNLFGVDVMKWALHCAELRLWLSMIVEEDLPPERRKEPLLPNFNLRLRIGDSLVQKIGDISFNLDDLNISTDIKRQLEYLKAEKDKFYRNDPSAKFKTPESIQNEENRIFCKILRDEKIRIEKEVQTLTIKLREEDQLTLYGKTDKDQVIKEQNLRKIADLKEQAGNITSIALELKSKGKQFIIWEIDFVDVFHDKKGFDVVIGNPPYIRQENIAPPFKFKEEVSLEDKRQYKEDLIKSIQFKYPFLTKIDKKSDYYIYFYFKGLSLVNPQGTFCFITSNSWLDVGYGRDLQEFLAKYVPIKAIYDNQAKRSFAHASINTIIVLLGAPQIKDKKTPAQTCLEHLAKFVMFKKPFEEVVSCHNMLTINDFFPEKQSLFGNIYKEDSFRIYALTQKELLLEGIEKKDKESNILKGHVNGKYKSSKWGGKYLRAPDIYFTILEKGKDKLVRLGDIADIRFGIKTGVNDFFYVEDVTDMVDFLKIKTEIKNLKDIDSFDDIKNKGLRMVYNRISDSYWLIEDEFLKPVIKSPRECKSIIVNIRDLKYKIFICNKPKKELKIARALDYILWGEKQKNKNEIQWSSIPSVSGRKLWYDVGTQRKNYYIWARVHNDSHRIFECYVYSADTFSVIYPRYDFYITGTILNSTLLWFMKELYGRRTLGEGGLGSLGADLTNITTLDPVIVPEKIKIFFEKMKIRDIDNVFAEFGFIPTKPLREQQPNPLPDRKALDDVIFDVLGLTENEREEVYWATAELVKNRLDKARSLKNK